MEQKTITITEDQADFIDSNYVKLSHFVQDKLDELMNERGISSE